MSAQHALRTDIQALRGIAVLAVLLYHANFKIAASGFLGVDVFFVVSGFLITGLIARAMDAGRFSLREFYIRRAKRLLPAATAIALATAGTSAFLLAPSDLEDLRWQLIGAATFVSNIVLWRQGGYFGGESALKPMLHTWSLGIEEQFYLILPVTMLLVPRKFQLRVAVMVTCASLALCLTRLSSQSTFYLLPTRAWELSVGSIGALVLMPLPVKRTMVALALPAFLAILIVAAVPLRGAHPAGAAILVTVCTLVVLTANSPLLQKNRVLRALAWMGDRSYSLYLVHWPVFAILANVWIGRGSDAPPGWLRLGLVGLSLILAEILYRGVENRWRHREWGGGRGVVVGSAALIAATISVGAMLAAIVPRESAAEPFREANSGLAVACRFEGGFELRSECVRGDAPELLVWGDSYAMHLVGALGGVGAGGLVQATRSQCGPLIGIAPLIAQNGYSRRWAESCNDFNFDVLQYLEQTSSVKVVAISSAFKQYLDYSGRLLVFDANGEPDSSVSPRVEVVAAALLRTVRAVQATGRRVVLISPPPQSEWNVALCYERRRAGLVSLGAPSDCGLVVPADDGAGGRVFQLLSVVGTDVSVIALDSLLCSRGICATALGDTVLYRDGGHLSKLGSLAIGNRHELRRLAFERAR